MGKFKLPGIASTDRSTTALEQRELVFDTNNNQVYLGDGTTSGGNLLLTNVNFSAGTTSGNLSNIIFSNSNGVSFGLDGSTITASFSGGGGAADGLNRIAAGTQTAGTLATVVFSNSNGITFGMSNSSIVTASHNGITTARASNDAIGLNTAQSNVTWTVGSNGLSLDARGYAGTQTGATNASITANSNGISVSVAAPVATAGLISAVTMGDINGIDVDVKRLDFTNLNGITMTMSTTTGGSITLVGSHNGLTSQSNQAFSADASSTFQTLVFQDSNGVSFSNNAGSLRVTHGLQYSSNTSNITVNAVNITDARIRAIYDGTNSISTGTIRYSNSNGISFGINGQTITASHNGITSQTNQDVTLYATGNTTGNSSTVLNANSLLFRGDGELSLGFSNGSIRISANVDAISAYAVSNTTQSSSGTLNVGSLSFAGAGVASVGISNGSVIVSVPSGGGGLTNVNVSAGTTSNNLSNFVFSNTNGISFGLNGSTITGSVPLNATISSWFEGIAANTLLTAPGNGVASVVRVQIPQDLSISMMAFPVYQSISSSGVGNTYGQQWSVYAAIMTNDTANSKFNSLSSGSTQTTYTVASNTAGVTQINGSGVRPITVPVNANLTPGIYHFIFNWSTNTFSSGTASTALNRTVSMLGRDVMMSASYAMVSAYDIATGVTNNVLWPQGCIAASNGIQFPVSHSTVTMTGASNSAANIAFFMRG